MEVELPKIDIVVSEWMGFRLLSEVMLDYLLYARDKDLKPGGLIFTDKTSLFIAGIENVESVSDNVDCEYNRCSESELGCR